MTPSGRVRAANGRPERRGGAYVLYWMTAFRRTGWNFALQHAVERARALDRPLVILEPLRAGYPWACDRFHRFVIDGMASQAKALAGTGVAYHPYVEPAPGEGRGLLAALAGPACVVVADDTPAFFHPRMLAAAAARLDTRVEAVDSVGLLPYREPGRPFLTAHAFRRYLQKELPAHLGDLPNPNPLERAGLPPAAELPARVLRRWPAARFDLDLRTLPIDHEIPPAAERGGQEGGRGRLARFLERGLPRYAAERSAPQSDAASGLSPWLHFGHLSAHEVFAAVAEREGWSPLRLSRTATGSKAGWWGMGPDAEAFLDELVTWRELAHGTAAHLPGYDRYESLPEWARGTLEEHASDPRPHVYTLEEFAAGATHDPLWNAAQAQLREEGRIHNYLRMLWGKKVLEWSPTPRRAIEILVELNNRYALDGRDPNSYAGIFWCLGRYDRPWAPRRPIFGSIRYMSSGNTARKFPVKGYLGRYGPAAAPRLL